MQLEATTFKHTIEYKTRVMTAKGWEKQKIRKEIIFDQLDETIKSQHRLHFKIVSLYKSKTDKNTAEIEMKLDPETLYDITTEAIRVLVHVDSDFSETDLKEFLSDSLGLLKFGRWFMGEHMVPFIVEYNS